MAHSYHGSCLCGEVEFEVDADPIIVSCCHCKNCKKYTGTVFASNIVFPDGSIKLTKGASLVSSFCDSAQDSGNAISRQFCSRCGTPLYNGNCDSGTTVSVFYSVLNDFGSNGDKGDAIPQVENYAKDRTSWIHPIDGAQQPRTRIGRND